MVHASNAPTGPRSGSLRQTPRVEAKEPERTLESRHCCIVSNDAQGEGG